MRGVIASGHKDSSVLKMLFDFREWLIDLRETDANRQMVRRDGNARSRADGSRVLGPFTIDVRKRILQRLKDLEGETGWSLISVSEEEIIRDIWRRDLILEDCRVALDRMSEVGVPEIGA